MLDVIIINGRIIDGTGNPWFRADVGIKNGKIVKIGDCSPISARRIINAENLMVSPGFIDIHSHSDFTLIRDPRAESKITQGVTTEVIGNCGLSAAPMNENTVDLLEKYLEPIRFNVKLEWLTMGEYLNQLEKQGVALNVASLVGHGTIRIAAMGFDNRPPTEKELNEMKKLLSQAMEDGVFGMSSGLIYPPGCYCDTKELIELCKVLANYGGIYATHIRNEGDALIKSVEEAIKVSEISGVPVQISHHKATGRANWGKVKESLKMIEMARKKGVDVTCDVYPYAASCTFLSAVIPTWAHEGGIEKLINRLKDPEIRCKLAMQIEEGIPGWENPARDSGWDKIMIISVSSEKNKHLEGKTIAEISQSRKEAPHNVTFDLLIEEPAAMAVLFEMCEEDVQYVMKHYTTMIGSDGLAVTPKGVLGEVKQHPRSYGTFPRVLGKYVREKGVLILEEAIRKMTSFPAQKLNLRTRGLLREGMWADITIFDPEEIDDEATFTDPHQFSKGIKYVLVNGKIVIDEGKHTGILPGKVLRHCK